jgi:predicted O-linked N-acetylglucosamine transferase (SPINDLY family)
MASTENSTSLFEQAVSRHEAGQLAEAQALYEQVIAADPEDADAMQLLAMIHVHQGRRDEGLKLLQQALAIDPLAPECHFNLGRVLAAMDRHETAIVSLRKALSLQPDLIDAYLYLGLSLRSTNQLAQAEAAFRQALAIKPDYVEALNNLAIVQRAQGRLEDAIATYRQAASLRSDIAAIHYNLGNALQATGRIDQAAAAYRESLKLRRDDPRLHSNLLLSMHFSPDSDPKEIFEEHLEWNHRHAEPLAGEIRPHANDRSETRLLRVGYVSPDFREHALPFFIEGLLAHHDPAAVEIFCYADISRPDSVTRRLEARVPNWRNITGKSDSDVAEMIRADRIDILVDLAGHMADNRLLVFARKPAPIQVSALGYPDTTGLTAIDYRISDAHLDPSGTTEQFYSETLQRLPRTFACYTPAVDSPEVSALPAASRGFITFGSFNSLVKLHPALLETWADILNQLPRSQMIIAAHGLQNVAAQNYFAEIFQKKGIGRGRLRFFGNQPLGEYLALHREIDLALDSFPINGHTVNCHAIWMGVPVITLAGVTCCQRLCSSVLSNLDLKRFVARTRAEYVKIAVEAASDLNRLAELRAGLRQRMRQSPIMDAAGYARDVEAAYRQMWRNWLQR